MVKTDNRQYIAILGSTGSIGRNTLDVIDRLATHFQVIALSAGSNIQLLAEQIAHHHPKLVAVSSATHAHSLQKLLQTYSGERPEILFGMDGMIAVATHAQADIVVSATVGALGLLPIYKAVELGRRVAIANKEPLVMAGELIQRQASISQAEILPVDSEHNALHQCLRGETSHEVKRLLLTASGGPFRNSSLAEMEMVSVEQAMQHPTWRMGRKITIDSATLMNKGLEVIEAHWLFGFAPECIDIIIHPQSIVHSMIEMVDGSVIAQMGCADMRLPIQYALTYPQRLPLALPPLDLTTIQKLEFFPPDRARFPAIDLAYRALKLGGVAPTILNAANEMAVAAFLDKKIRFTDITRVIGQLLENSPNTSVTTIEDLLQADARARYEADSLITEINRDK